MNKLVVIGGGPAGYVAQLPQLKLGKMLLLLMKLILVELV